MLTETTDATPRQKRREATTERVLDAAALVLGNEGVEALTMARLANELGYTVGATYRYFASKDAIIAALQRRVFTTLQTDLLAALGQAVETAGSDPIESQLSQAATVAYVYATIFERRPLDARLLGMLLANPNNVLASGLGEQNAQMAFEVGTHAVAVFRSARESGALSPGDDIERVLVLWSSLQGVAFTRKLERWGIEKLSANQLSQALVHTLFLGWGASPEALSKALHNASKISREPT